MNLYLYVEMRRMHESGESDPIETDLSYVSGRHVWIEAEDKPSAYRAGEMTCAQHPLANHSDGRFLGDYLVQMTDSVTPDNRSIDESID